MEPVSRGQMIPGSHSGMCSVTSKLLVDQSSADLMQFPYVMYIL